jgi:GNAT superfamily N-acetyltransferase
MAKTKKIKVREAKPGDRNLFKKLWLEYLQESYENSRSDVLPIEENIEVFAHIFDQYIDKESGFDGIVLFIAEDAILMWGTQGAPALKTHWEKIANGWGTYVREAARGKGYSTKIREVAKSKLKDMGFDVVLGTAVDSNESGVNSGVNAGFEPHSKLYILKLDKE